MEERHSLPTEIVKDGKVTRRTFVKGAGWPDHHVRHRRQCPWLRPRPRRARAKMTSWPRPARWPIEEGFTCKRALAAR